MRTCQGNGKNKRIGTLERTEETTWADGRCEAESIGSPKGIEIDSTATTEDGPPDSINIDSTAEAGVSSPADEMGPATTTGAGTVGGSGDPAASAGVGSPWVVAIGSSAMAGTGPPEGVAIDSSIAPRVDASAGTVDSSTSTATSVLEGSSSLDTSRMSTCRVQEPRE